MFAADNSREFFRNIVDCDYDLETEFWETISDEAKDLIGKLVLADPNERITAEQILSHPWFNLFT